MDEKIQLDRAEYQKNSLLMENTPLNEVLSHFGIKENVESDGQYIAIHNNRLLERERLALNFGVTGRKRVVIDFDPEYFCFLIREIPYADIIE